MVLLFIKATEAKLLTRKDGVQQHYHVKDGSDLSLHDSISAGKRAMRRVVAKKQSVKRAMYRKEFGWIDFPWGTEGDPPDRKGKRKGGYGVSHILEARVRKDGFAQSQAVGFLDLIVESIARGAHSESRYQNTKTGAGGTKSVITHDGVAVVLLRADGGDSWLMTGYGQNDANEVPSVVSGQDGGKTGTTHAGSIPLVHNVGAEGGSTITPNQKPINKKVT